MPGSDTETTSEVVHKVEIADEVVHLTLRSADGRRLPSWEPGAHVDLVFDAGMVRQYSLCGDPDDLSTYEVAVLRERESRGGSDFVHDKLEEGATVVLRGPRNTFALHPAAHHVFIAGGIGITPILPMLRVLGDAADWSLLYGGRTRRSMAFVDDLRARYGDRVRIRPEDETGLLDLDGALGEAGPGTAVYCCGPGPLLDAIAQRCRSWPEGSLHVERFAPMEQDHAPSRPFRVELARSGVTLTVPCDRSIVEVLDEAGIDVDVSCEEGICGTCETAVLGGTPDHRDSILTDAQRARHDRMFLCVSRSRSPVLRLDR